MKKFLNLLPLIAFVILIAVLYSFLTQDNDQLESVLVDQSVPEFTLPSLENPEITISKTHLVYVAEVQEDVCKKYNEMFGSKLITPDSKKLIV